MINFTQQSPNTILVFIGGVISFFSPCVLPLIPIYLSYLAGTQITEKFTKKDYINLVTNTLAFVLGISTVFILLGIGATTIGQTLNNYKDIIRKVGGIFVIILGVNYSGLIKINLFNKEKRYTMKNYKANLWQSFLLGFTFSFGWTPCLSSFITPVLFMASIQGKVLSAIILLLIYSLGFAIPFILMSLFASFTLKYIKNIYKYMDKIRLVSGIFLIILGILLFTNYLKILTI